MSNFKKVTAGLALAAGILAVASGSLPPLGALLLGAAFSMAFGAPSAAGPISRQLLAASIVALGFGLDLNAVLAAGRDGLMTTTLMLTLTFGCGILLARWLGLRPDLALLVTAGTAICGGSAIATLAPLMRARAADVTAAFGVVFLLNAVALLVFPAVGAHCELDAEAFGQWCALAIHDTSSVLGAAATFSDEALKIATVTKLTRALWIIPVGTFVVYWRQRQTPSVGQPRLPVPPWFLIGFLGAAITVSAFPQMADRGLKIAAWAPVGMKLSLFGIGLGLDRATLKRVAGRALAFGFILWLLLTTATLAYVALEMTNRKV